MKRRFLISLMPVALAVLALTAGVARAQKQTLTLEDVVTRAIEQSTVVGVSRERLQSARQNVLANYGRFLPDATMSTYAGRSYIGPTGSVSFDSQGRPVQPAGFDFESYSFSLGSSMMLFDWGVSYKQVASAKRGSEAAEQDLQYQKDIITAQAIRAFYNLLRDENLRKVQEESVRAAQRNLEQVEAFFKIGSNTRADVLQAKVRLGNTQLALITARNNEEISRAALQSLLNLPFDQDFDMGGSLDVTKVEPDLREEIDYMLGHRSELLANRKRVSAAGDNVTAAQNSRWPTLAASMRYGWNDRAWPEHSNFFNTEYSWGLGVSLNFNIFDRFQTKSNILNAQAQHRIAEYNLQQSKLDAIFETRRLYLGLKEADERIRVSEETVSQAQENLRLAEERYRVGAGTILETIEAGVSLTEAQSSLIQAKCDYLVAKADLLRATGRPVHE